MLLQHDIIIIVQIQAQKKHQFITFQSMYFFAVIYTNFITYNVGRTIKTASCIFKTLKKEPSFTNELHTVQKHYYFMTFMSFVCLISGANAIIVVSASGVVAILHSYGHNETLSITGKVQSGLPPFRFPHTSLHNGNETLAFGDILGVNIYQSKIETQWIFYVKKIKRDYQS